MSALHSESLLTDGVELFAKVIPEAYQDFLMCSHKKRLRTCLLIMSLIIKFMLRMTRILLIATFNHSLAQSLVSFANSSTICLARGSSNHPNHQQAHLFSLPRRRMAPCDSVLTSRTSTRS